MAHKYAYVGITRSNQKVKGEVEAHDDLEAKLKLRGMSIRATSLKRSSGLNMNMQLSFGPPIDLKGLLVFTRQFSSLIDAGVPVVQGLDILAQQEKRPGFKSILLKVKEDIESGGSLADALSKHPKVFNEMFVRIVEAGEVAGSLDEAFRRLGTQIEKLDRLRAKVKSALMYPVMTLLVAVTVMIFLLVKVIPEISKLYGDNNAKLPELTVQVLALSSWVQANYLILIAVIVSIVVGIILLQKLPGFKRVWDPFILHIPLFGSLIKRSSIAKFTRTLATLVASGVPLLGAFDICAKIVSNLAVRSVIQGAARAVAEGKSIAVGLAKNAIFPPMVIQMVSIGESTGKLDELLLKISEIYDDEVDDAVSAITGMIQPALIILVGGIIAFLLIAMYLPIFQLAEKVTDKM
ncbi:MAG: type II secretion system F family protein [Deltaproteobacteria bacterium]|nr:type II secretion system F family protein [Deltaproteobacteria bacterium]